MYFGIICRHREIALGQINPLAHIPQCGVRVKARVKLQEHVRPALVAAGTHLLDSLNRLERLLHGPDQQALGIFGGDTVMTHRDIDDRNIDIRLRLFGNILISNRPGDQDKEQDREYGS